MLGSVAFAHDFLTGLGPFPGGDASHHGGPFRPFMAVEIQKKRWGLDG